MKKSIFPALAIAMMMLSSCCEKTTKIACVGDSVTEGATIQIQSVYGYPVVFENNLDENYTVLNFGKSGTVMQINGDVPYWECKEFHNVFSSKPDIVIINLGTNDTKPQNWIDSETFAADYQAMIDTFKTIESNPEIILCLPVPAFEVRWGITDSVLTAGVIPAIEKLAETNNLRLIDLNTELANQPDMFSDGIHPNEDGAKKIGELMAKTIKENRK